VTASDLSAQMLDVCRKNASAAGHQHGLRGGRRRGASIPATRLRPRHFAPRHDVLHRRKARAR
jgi:hypothetical protein